MERDDICKNHLHLAGEAVEHLKDISIVSIPDRVRMTFYLHALHAICSALLAIAAAIVSFRDTYEHWSRPA